MTSIGTVAVLGLGSVVSAVYFVVLGFKTSLDTLGQLMLVVAILRIVAPIARLGLGQYAVESASNSLHHRRAIMRATLISSGAATILLVAVGLGWRLSVGGATSSLLLVMAVALPAINASSTIGQFLMTGGKPVAASVLQTLLAPLVSLAILLSTGDPSPSAAAAGYVVGWIVSAAVAVFLHPDRGTPTPGEHISARTVASDALPYLQAGVLVQGMDQLPLVLAAPLLSGSELAYLGLTLRVLAAFGLVSGGLVASHLAQLLNADHRGRGRILSRLRVQYLALAVPGAMVLVLTAPWLFDALGAQAGMASRPAMAGASALAALAGWCAPSVAALTIEGDRAAVRSVYVGGLLGVIVLMPVAGIVAGAQGAVIGAVSSSALASVVAAWLYRRHGEIRLADSLSSGVSDTVLSVVTVVHNSAADLPGLLDSLSEHLVLPYEVVVVDSASEASELVATRAIVEERRPTADGDSPIVLISSHQNIGLGAGTNLGAAAATGGMLLLINPDARLLGPIDSVVAAALSDSIGAATGRALKDGEHYLHYGRFPSVIRPLPRQLLGPEVLADETGLVDWVEGSFMLVCTERFQSVGGFDEEIFMYGEDLDLCYRLRKAGWRSVVVGEVSFAHAGGYVTERRAWVANGLDHFFRSHRSPSAQIVRRIARAAGDVRSREVTSA